MKQTISKLQVIECGKIEPNGGRCVLVLPLGGILRRLEFAPGINGLRFRLDVFQHRPFNTGDFTVFDMTSKILRARMWEYSPLGADPKRAAFRLDFSDVPARGLDTRLLDRALLQIENYKRRAVKRLDVWCWWQYEL